MLRSLPYLVASLAVAFSASSVASAQTSARFTRLSVEDGLSQSSVQQILQDRKGLMWFGTQEGLSRWDGYRMTVHRARQSDGFLRDHDITALVDDAKGDLWVGTSRGLYRHDLDTGRFDTCASPVHGLGILKLIRGGDGRIVFTTSDSRLWVIDPTDPTRTPRALNVGAFAALSQITALAAGSGSTIWAAANGNLYKIEDAASAGRLTHVHSDLGTITVMSTDAQDDVWLGGSNGVLRFRAATKTLERLPLSPRNVLAILPASGEIWIGARRGGLSRLDPNTGEMRVYRHDPESTASLASDDVPAIYEDGNGSLWIGSWNGGVSRFDPHAQAFETIRHRARLTDSLPANDITVMTELPDGSLWAVSRSGIVGAGDPRAGRFRTVAALGTRGRVSTLEAWDGRVFVGTSEGLVVFDAVSGREVVPGAALQTHRLGERPITALRHAGNALWIATGRELFRAFRDPHDAPITVERFDVPFSGTASALSTATNERVWLASDRGEIIRVDFSGESVVLRPLEIAEAVARESFTVRGFVTTLQEDRDGRLWIGTRRGLGRVDVAARQVSWLGDDQGLPSTNIAGLVVDADGRVWIAHNSGVTRLDTANSAMTHFGEAEGAQGKGYADGAWAYGGASGRIYFAGEGITSFDPRAVAVSPFKPRILFTGLEILHRPVAPRWMDPASPLERTIDAQSEVTLGPEATVFSVEMAALDYADPSTNRLRYRLEGFDRDWIETGAHNRVATYTNLAPGRYVLRALAGTRNGAWSDREVALTIHLLPPWWRTNAALALWFVLALVAAGLVWRSAQRRAKVKLALLERETLRRESLTDALTGLHNRRFLVSWLDQEVPKLLRDRAELLLVLVDVDHFKSINDRHSHAVGDRVLLRIATALKDAIRGSDLAVRWGGDEFLVVIRSLQRELAADSVERLRAAIEAIPADSDSSVTVSLGFAAFPFLPHEPEALSWVQTLELADHALGLTKRRQRNSFTGLRATSHATSAAVREWLAGGPRPSGVEVMTRAAD